MEILCKVGSVKKKKKQKINISNIKGNGFDILNVYVDKNGLWIKADVTDKELKDQIMKGFCENFSIELNLLPLSTEPKKPKYGPIVY